MTQLARVIAAPFVVAPPRGVRIRARLRVSPRDEAVLREVGGHLGHLASADLAARCRAGHGAPDAGRAGRKRALTAASSSRWAGAITRISGDQWERGWRNLYDQRATLRAAISRIERRAAVTVGQRRDRVRGYATQAEHWQKQRRLQILRTRLQEVEQRITDGQVSVCRGGAALARTRHHLGQAGISEGQWRSRWEAARWFLHADGEAGTRWGNQTIRVYPGEGWVEIKLPAPLAGLANAPHGRYRLDAGVVFSYRRGEWAAQAASAAVAYTIWHDPGRGRWYLDASWTLPPRPAPALEDLTSRPVLGVDTNAGHLAAWVLDPYGNPTGQPVTVPLDLAGLPATARDGRLRHAVSTLISIAKTHGCATIAIEDLDFAQARAEGRETLGRGRRGKALRRTVGAIPTAQLRHRMASMASNAGLAVIAVDPAYTSRWGAQHWRTPLSENTRTCAAVTVHHAAAVVIGRRSHGHRARRRPGVTRPHQRMGSGRATGQATPDGCGGEEPRTRQRRPAPPPVGNTAPPDPAARGRPGGPAPFGATHRAGHNPAQCPGTVEDHRQGRHTRRGGRLW